jgi:GNAT superfamily N-acetyltransferase
MMITDRAAGPARLREFAGRVNERGLPCTLWLTRDQLDHLSAEASALGFAPAGTWRLMVLDPDTVVPATSIAGLTIVSGLEAQAEMIRFLNADGVSTEQAERHFGPEFIEAPGLDLFIARNEGQPIATVTTTRGGSTVGIWAMITLDAYQRQGIGYALLAHAINHYRAGGARLFYLISTEAGARLYQKMGFQTLDEVAVWRRKSVEGVARV